MISIRKRLEDVEMFKAYKDFVLAKGQFAGRTRDELKFFSIHGYFPVKMLRQLDWSPDGSCQFTEAFAVERANREVAAPQTAADVKLDFLWPSFIPLCFYRNSASLVKCKGTNMKYWAPVTDR